MTFAIFMSLITLGLYCMQQLGMALAVGAETVLLVAYLHAVRDGVVDDEEKGFARAVRGVKDFGLFFIIVSGGALIANQFLTEQLSQFLSIVVLFKWSLIGIALFLGFIRGSSLTSGLLQGLSAGTWYALFAVHILAPEASWIELATFYGIWLVGFSVCWSVLVFALRNKKPIAIIAARPASAKPRPSVVIVPDNKVVPITPIAKPVSIVPDIPSVVKPVLSTAPPAALSTTISAPPPAVPKPPVALPPVPKPPVPPPLSAPNPPVPPPAPMATPSMPPPPVPQAQAPVTAPPASWLHVMPRTPEEVEKRKSQTT